MEHVDTSRSSLDETELQALVAQAKEGNEAALTQLIREFEPFVRGSAMKVCENPEKAGATAQDTLVSIFRKLHQFEGDSKFTTWLYTIVINHCTMNRRRRKLEQALVSLDEIAEGDDAGTLSVAAAAEDDTPMGRLLARELKQVLEEVTAKLPTEYREVFLLREVEGLTNSEAAERLGLSLAAVKSRLHRARGLVRAEVEKYLEG